MNFENILNNLIFGLLFFTVISTADIQPSRGGEAKKVNDSKNEKFSNNFSNFFSSWVNSIVFLVFLTLTFVLINRWIESGHPPLSNLYESLLFLTWTFLFFFIGLAAKPIGFLSGSPSEPALLFDISESTISQTPAASDRFAANLPGEIGDPNDKIDRKDYASRKFQNSNNVLDQFISFLFLATALFFYTFANWLLPSEMQTITPLVPALQSNWLLMHVSIMLLSYSSLLAGSLFSITYLFVFHLIGSDSDENSEATDTLNQPQMPPPDLSSSKWDMYDGVGKADTRPIPTKLGLGVNELVGFGNRNADSGEEFLSFKPEIPLGLSSVPSLNRRFGSTTKILNDLDQYSYRSLSFAFPLLTLGIISGAVWANEAWGSYWSWDPKETWAFITWLIFASYLHVRLNKGWKGKKAAWVATLGFFMVWVCYLGVNLIGKGLHSYGWWEN